MSNIAGSRHRAEFMTKLYPAYSRKATQVCVLYIALEKIARGASDAQAIALLALEQANPFDWNSRVTPQAQPSPEEQA
jgi:hypothetical protein